MCGNCALFLANFRSSSNKQCEQCTVGSSDNFWTSLQNILISNIKCLSLHFISVIYTYTPFNSFETYTLSYPHIFKLFWPAPDFSSNLYVMFQSFIFFLLLSYFLLLLLFSYSFLYSFDPSSCPGKHWHFG